MNPPQPLLDKANALGCPLLVRGRDFDLACTEQAWHWRGLDAKGQALELRDLPLLDLPMENAALALQAYALTQLPWQPERITDALLSTHVTGRLDRRQFSWQGKALNVLLDVGHNPHAAEYLVQRLRQRPVSGKRLAVFGLLADKDLEGVVSALDGCIEHWAVAPLNTARTRPASQLQATLEQYGASVSVYDSIAAALQAQSGQAVSGDEIVLFGSFYCVAEALDWLERHVTQEAENGFAG